VIVCEAPKRNLDIMLEGVRRVKVKEEPLVIINKSDVGWGGGFCVSALSGEGIGELKEQIYRRLRLVRVYLKPRGGEVDRNRPLVVREGSAVRDVWEKLRLRGEMGFAMVWGDSAKFPGQKVGVEHILKDGDVITIAVK